MTTTDEARVTDEEIRDRVHNAMQLVAHEMDDGDDRVILELHHRLAARDAERDEMVALLEDVVRNRIGREFPSLATDCENMLAKLRGTP